MSILKKGKRDYMNMKEYRLLAQICHTLFLPNFLAKVIYTKFFFNSIDYDVIFNK